MRTNLKKAVLILGVACTALTGCRKETLCPGKSTIDVSGSGIDAMVIQTGAENNSADITYIEATGIMLAGHDGLAYDYLVISEDFDNDEAAVRSGAPARGVIRNYSFIRCLRAVKPDAAQTRKIKDALAGYEDCKASATARARAISKDLEEKYQAFAREQTRLFNAGKITRAELDARISRIRQAFGKELKEMQLKEKLDEALKSCHEKFLKQLHGILTARQWNAFAGCNKK